MKKIIFLVLISITSFSVNAQTAFYNGKQDTPNDQQNYGYECVGIDPLSLSCAVWDKTVFYFWGGDEVDHRFIIETIRSGNSLKPFQIEGSVILARVTSNSDLLQDRGFPNYINAVLVVCEKDCFDIREYASILESVNYDYSIHRYVARGE